MIAARLTALAWCLAALAAAFPAGAGAMFAGVHTVKATTISDSATDKTVTATKSVTAACPAGKHVLGSWASVSPRTGDVVIDDLRPDPSLRKVTVTGLEDRTGYAGDWSTHAYAICADR